MPKTCDSEMGYSLAPGPGPVLPEPHKITRSAKSQKRHSYILRSSGFTNNGELTEKSEYLRNEQLSDIRDFLKTEAPPSDRTDPNRLKSALDLFFRLGHLSPRQLKHILRTRRAKSLPDNVKMHKTATGRKYLQIGIDSIDLRGECNSSTYHVNNQKEPTETLIAAPAFGNDAAETRPSRAEKANSMIDDFPMPMPRLQSPEDEYFLGISRDYPHLVLANGKIQPSDGAKNETKTASRGKSLPRPKNGLSVRDFTSSSLFGIMAADQERLVNTVSGASSTKSDVAQSHGIQFRVPSNSTSNIRISASQSPESMPMKYQRHPRVTPRKSSRNSGQEFSSIEMHLASLIEGHSKRNSLQQDTEPAIRDECHHTSSGVVMSSPSTEFSGREAAACCYVGASHGKLPIPGPAPTRALPSLPESHRTTVDRRSESDPSPMRLSSKPTQEQAPTKVPPKSSARRHKFSTVDYAVTRLRDVPSRSNEPQGIGHTPPQSPKSTLSMGTMVSISHNENTNAVTSPSTLDQLKKERTQSTKALKRRDFERLRARNESGNAHGERVEKPSDEEDDEEQVVDLASTMGLYSSPRDLAWKESQCPVASESNSSMSKQRRAKDERIDGNDVSPVLLVVEQEPTVSGQKDPEFFQAKYRTGQSERIRENGTSVFPARRPPASASLPVLNGEGKKCHSSESPMIDERRFSIERSNTTATPGPEDPNVSLFEQRFDARLTAVEKKNVFLEAALLAVINVSANFGSQPSRSSGDRSSGFSGTSSLYAPMESRLDSLEALVSLMHRSGSGRHSREVYSNSQ
ncbi:hypothetical protein MMC12_007576 [Toensbergia leucococca]|nr:hypothetical protein [Toensbergia leucococca]